MTAFYTGPNASTTAPGNGFYGPVTSGAASKLGQQQPPVTDNPGWDPSAQTPLSGRAPTDNSATYRAPTDAPVPNTSAPTDAPYTLHLPGSADATAAASAGPVTSGAASMLGSLPGSSAPTTGPLSGPGYNESWYAQHGNDLSGPTNSQKLFDEGAAGSNPFYENAMNQTDKSINAAENARGDWNSSAALGTIGSANADIMGQQALGLTNLGSQADTENTAQFTAGSNASNTAQQSTQNRINGDITANMNLSTAQSNLVDNFYQMAQTGSLTADMASIEAQLQASGVDAATAQALTNDILTAGGVVAKVAGK